MAEYQSASIYPENALQNAPSGLDVIDPTEFNSISELFVERVRRTPDSDAYIEYKDGRWQSITWSKVGEELARWRAAF